MKTFQVTEDTNLKDFTDFTYPQGAFCLDILLRNRDVRVNGVKVGKNLPLHKGDSVAYYTTPKQESAKSHYTVYEDDEILVLDKLDGVTSEGLLSELNSARPVFAVHRLDRNTLGLIVFAKSEEVQKRLVEEFKMRKVVKSYLALCKNNFKAPSKRLEDYLIKNPTDALVKIYSTRKENAVNVITEYKVIKAEGDIALTEITLHTGRTHQIRAHMAYIGCPVLGDGKYGDGVLNKKYKKTRQCLISHKICLDGKRFESKFAFSRGEDGLYIIIRSEV